MDCAGPYFASLVTGRRSAPRSHQSAPDHSQRRRANNAEQGIAMSDQRQIDGEFVAAGDKFPRAVEWVDQKEAVLVWAAAQHERVLPTGPAHGVSALRGHRQ